MTTADHHRERLIANARAAGITIEAIDLPGFGEVAVSYRRDFRRRWMATSMHTFTFIAPHPPPTPAELTHSHQRARSTPRRTSQA